MHAVILHESAPNPIRIPLFNCLAKEFRRAGDRLTVAWLRDRIPDKNWDPQLVTVEHDSRRVLSSAAVARFLVLERPDVVVCGYASLAGWIGWFYALLFRRALVNWSGTWDLACDGHSFIKKALKKLFVRGTRHFVAYGSKPAEYLQGLGARPTQIEVACNVADTSYYRDGVPAFRAHPEFSALRSRHRRLVLIAASRLVRQKGFHELLSTLARLRHYENWELIIAGRGPAELEIRSTLANFGLTDRVTLTGFLDRPQLLRWFAVADIFVQPSLLDRFSLVLSEALHAGLYSIGSPFDGASYDLIQPGINGEIVNPRNVEAFANVLEAIFLAPDRLPSREQVSNSVADCTIERYAATIARAVRNAAGASVPEACSNAELPQ